VGTTRTTVAPKLFFVKSSNLAPFVFFGPGLPRCVVRFPRIRARPAVSAVFLAIFCHREGGKFCSFFFDSNLKRLKIIRRRWRWRRVFAPTAVIPTVRGRSSPDKTLAGRLYREMTANRVAIRAEEGSAPPLDDHHRWSAVGRRRERRPPRILGLPVHSRPGGPVCAPCARAQAAHPPALEHGVVAAWCVR